MRNRISIPWVALLVWLAFGGILAADVPPRSEALRAPERVAAPRRPPVQAGSSPVAVADPRPAATPIPASQAMPRRARRDPLPSDAPSKALFIARLYVVESDVHRPIDRAIMVHILDDRREVLRELWGRPISLVEAADLYSSGTLRLRPRGRFGRLRWILEVDDSGVRPEAFPARWSWERFSAGFEEVLVEAAGHIAGERPPDPCEDLAGSWGGGRGLELTSDRPRASMERIVCHEDQILRTYSTARTRRRAR